MEGFCSKLNNNNVYDKIPLFQNSIIYDSLWVYIWNNCETDLIQNKNRKYKYFRLLTKMIFPEIARVDYRWMEAEGTRMTCNTEISVHLYFQLKLCRHNITCMYGKPRLFYMGLNLIMLCISQIICGNYSSSFYVVFLSR